MAAALKTAAAHQGKTMNDVVRSLIGTYLKAEAERMLYDGFSWLGSDPEESRVEYAIHAASDVVLGHD
jgi:hypothetical protein